jgi:hypothetical protein
MITNTTDLVEYLRLHGEDNNFKNEYRKRINEDNINNLILTKDVRLYKIDEIFDNNL